MEKSEQKLLRKKILIKSIDKNDNKNSRSINISSFSDDQNSFQKMLSNDIISSINLKTIKSKNDFIHKNFLKSMGSIESIKGKEIITPKYYNLKFSNRNIKNKKESNIFSKMNDNFSFNYILMNLFFKKKESQNFNKLGIAKQKYYQKKYILKEIKSLDIDKKAVNKIFELRPESKNNKDIKIDNKFLKRKMNKIGSKSSITTCLLSYSNNEKNTIAKENKDQSKESKKEGNSFPKKFRIHKNRYNNLIMPSIIKNSVTKNKTINFIKFP